jgi:protein FRG1
MSDAKVRPSKLKFKGEKSKKKRKREHDDEAGPSSSKRREEEDLDTWVLPEGANEIRGPTFIVHPSDPFPLSINFNATAGKVVLHSLDKDQAEDSDEPLKIMDRTPTDVAQVWVVTRIAGSPTINIRTGTGEGKFLSCDKYGLVSADRDARGPQEEWTPVVFPDGMVAFMNMYEKYLSVDEVAGGALQLRGDSEEVGFRERFWVKIQYKYKKEANEEEKQRKEGASGPSAADELTAKYAAFIRSSYTRVLTRFESSKLYQTWGAGRTVLSSGDKKEVRGTAPRCIEPRLICSP